jgi:3-deoxy-7-phosphoheptulonate synthase
VIIVVSPEAAPEDIDLIIARIEESGRQAHLSVGTERSIIGVIGPDAPELQDMFETMPHVESVHRVTKPYKLVSRDFHPDDSVISVGKGVTVGGHELAVMAGPCSIENERHIIETAHAVKARGANILRGGAYKPRSSPYAFRGLGEQGLKFDVMQTSFFLSRETLIATRMPGMALWRERLFVSMARNAGSAMSFFKIPTNRVVELGTQVEL